VKEHGEISPPRSDAPEIEMPDGFWDGAELKIPATKKPVSLRVDLDILEIFHG